MLAYIIVLQHSHPSYQQCRVSFVPVAIGSHAHRKMTWASNHRTEMWLVGMDYEFNDYGISPFVWVLLWL